MNIEVDDLSGSAIRELLQAHLQSALLDSPPESVHALDVEGLRKPEVTFWAAWENDELLGCGALKELDSQHGEIKSMRTASGRLRKGVARSLLIHIIDEARRRGYSRLSLETGSMEAQLCRVSNQQSAFSPTRSQSLQLPAVATPAARSTRRRRVRPAALPVTLPAPRSGEIGNAG